MIGKGVDSHPFLIGTFDDLKKVGRGVIDGVDYSLDSYYKLISDIDASPTKEDDYECYSFVDESEVYEGSGVNGYGLDNIMNAGWSPIGNPDREEFFTGVFDGGKHIISNLYINRPEEEFVGFISRERQASKSRRCLTKVFDLNLKDFDITGGDNVGSICGSCASFKIENCNVSGKIKGYNYVGGVVGFSDNGIELMGLDVKIEIEGNNNLGGILGSGRFCLRDSYVDAKVKGSYNIGGVIGSVQRQVFSENILSKLYVNSFIDGRNYVGGLIGNSSVAVNASEVEVKGEVKGDNYVGGVFGSSRTERGALFNHIKFSGLINGFENVGGISGENFSREWVSQCEFKGEVNGTKNVGGIFGSSSGAGTFLRHYSCGKVNGVTNVGGILGKTSEASIKDSYFKGEAKGFSNVGGLIGNSDEGVIDNSCVIDSIISGSITNEVPEAITEAEGSQVVSKNIGGLIGNSNRSSISNSFVFATIEGRTIAGLVGRAHFCNLDDSYFGGNLKGYYVAGLTREGTVNVINNCFWNKESSGVDHTLSGHKGSRTSQEMKQKDTFDNWDFKVKWHETDNNPFLWGLPEELIEYQGVNYEPLEFEVLSNERDEQGYGMELIR